MKFMSAITILLISTAVSGQMLKRTFSLTGTQPAPSSNSASQILILGNRIFFATNKGINISTDGGKTFQTDFGKNSPTGSSANSLAVTGDTIAVAISTNSIVSGDLYPVGEGLYTSTDNGTTWNFEPQSIDTVTDTTVIFGIDTLRSLPVTTTVNNISYSMAFYDGYLYSANFAGGLRRTRDLGKTWERVVLPPDNLNYINADSVYTFQLSPVAGSITDQTNLNHRVFSVFSDDDSALYVGTAGGINKTTDGGHSWYKLTHAQNGFSGNFVVSIASQDYNGEHILWGATINAEASDEVEALSYSTDDGSSWQYILKGHFFHTMAFDDKTVYAVSDDGLFRTSDLGASAQVITTVHDFSSGASSLGTAFYAVATAGDTVWAGSGDGIVRGIDNGTELDPNSWTVYRVFVSSASGSPSTYFYPNPFSPRSDVGRVHYYLKPPGGSVTIRVYDFSMRVVATVIQNAARTGGDQDDVWNGLDSAGKVVDNGVYFYDVQADGGTPAWGKILVVR